MKFVDQKRKSRLCSCLTINIYHPKDPKPNHKIKEANATNVKKPSKYRKRRGGLIYLGVYGEN